LTSNLGIATAQAGQSVLILDTDFRRPVQHKIFGFNRGVKGLSAVLTGQIGLEDASEHSGVESLDILICGPSVPNPSELLSGERFARMMEELISRYDRAQQLMNELNRCSLTTARLVPSRE
jgi:Mrp family chromosome partitioning ATPase